MAIVKNTFEKGPEGWCSLEVTGKLSMGRFEIR